MFKVIINMHDLYPYEKLFASKEDAIEFLHNESTQWLLTMLNNVIEYRNEIESFYIHHSNGFIVDGIIETI